MTSLRAIAQEHGQEDYRKALKTLANPASTLIVEKLIPALEHNIRTLQDIIGSGATKNS